MILIMNDKLKSFKASVYGKTVGVIGIGISNTPLIKMLVDSGANVVARDIQTADKLVNIASELEELGVKLILGDAYLEDIYEEIVFKTPGIHIDTKQLVEARENGTVITSEMEAFFEVCPCKIIAVTGSDGKTTTTTLIYEILKQQGYKCWLGGNIGKPLLCEAEKMSEADIAILELSSFQLHTIKKSPHIAVVTNLSPNHLDIHKSMEEYISAKENIFAHQNKNDKLILNYDNEITASMAQKAIGKVIFFSRTQNIQSGVYIKDNAIYFNDKFIIDIDDIAIPGVHNVENYMAAIAAVYELTDEKSIEAVAKTFRGVAHRIEFVREIDGVKYYNDSIASSPTRTRAGLYSFSQKVILIAGGYDKKIPFDDLGNDIVEKVKTLVLIGKTAPKIKYSVLNSEGYSRNNPIILEATELLDAVKLAKQAAQMGDIIIMSPACASFDMFKNFEVRGNLFKEIVMGL